MDQKFDTPVYEKMLDISTGHITQSDADKLFKAPESDNGLTVYIYEFGYIVHVTDDEGLFGELMVRAQEAKYSTDFLRILQKAYDTKCHYVKFDCDGTTYSDLTYYNW